jgi:phosphonate transport system ATP-binding protein
MQRVAIARAMFQKPELFLADEPIASLDPSNSLAIMKLLRPLAAATPVVGVFHQPEMTARFCTRVIAIKHGRIIYDGAPELSHAELEEIYGNELMEVLRPAPVISAPAPLSEAAHSAGLELAKLA